MGEASGKREWVRWACPKFFNTGMGQYSMARCTGRADTTMHSAPAAKVTKRQYASLAFNWIRILFGRWNTRHPMTITGKGSVVDRAATNTDVRIMWKNVAGFPKPEAFSA